MGRRTITEAYSLALLQLEYPGIIETLVCVLAIDISSLVLWLLLNMMPKRADSLIAGKNCSTRQNNEDG